MNRIRFNSLWGLCLTAIFGAGRDIASTGATLLGAFGVGRGDRLLRLRPLSDSFLAAEPVPSEIWLGNGGLVDASGGQVTICFA
jgi:hypothetical protein